nr:hypothetical protein Iba_chr12bCG16120 [Ipomoea batatas]
MSLPRVARLVMARSNGSRRSKRSAPGHPFSPSTPASAGALGVAKASRSSNSRSGRRFPPARVHPAFYWAAIGVASRVSARLLTAHRWAQRVFKIILVKVKSKFEEGKTQEQRNPVLF